MKKYFQITNFNIGKLDPDYFKVEYYAPEERVTLNGDIVLYKKIVLLGQPRFWMKLGYICEPRALNLPIFIWQKNSAKTKKIKLNKNGMYELQPQLIELKGENIILKPNLTAIAVPYDLVPSLDEATIDREKYFEALPNLLNNNTNYNYGIRKISRDTQSTEEQVISMGGIRIDDETVFDKKIYAYLEEYNIANIQELTDNNTRPPRPTLYFWSNAGSIFLPENSSEFFKGTYWNSGNYLYDWATEINLSIFNLYKVTNLSKAFSHIGNINSNMPVSVSFSENVLTYNCKNISAMFEYFFGNIDGLNNFDTTNLEDISYLFDESTLLNESIVLNNWYTFSLKRANSAFNFSSSNRRLITNINIDGWELRDITDCTSIASIFSWSHSAGGQGDDYVVLNKLSANNLKINNNISLTRIFQNVKEIEMNNFFTTNTIIEGLFYDVTSLREIQMNNFSAPSATSLKDLFHHNYASIDIEMKNANFSNVKEIDRIFAFCSNGLITLGDWTITPETITGEIAYDCGSIPEIDLSGWDFSLVRHMYADLFAECQGLEIIYSPTNFFDSKYVNEHRDNMYHNILLNEKPPILFPNYSNLIEEEYWCDGNMYHYVGIAIDLFPSIVTEKRGE